MVFVSTPLIRILFRGQFRTVMQGPPLMNPPLMIFVGLHLHPSGFFVNETNRPLWIHPTTTRTLWHRGHTWFSWVNPDFHWSTLLLEKSFLSMLTTWIHYVWFQSHRNFPHIYHRSSFYLYNYTLQPTSFGNLNLALGECERCVWTFSFLFSFRFDNAIGCHNKSLHINRDNITCSTKGSSHTLLDLIHLLGIAAIA